MPRGAAMPLLPLQCDQKSLTEKLVGRPMSILFYLFIMSYLPNFTHNIDPLYVGLVIKRKLKELHILIVQPGDYPGPNINKSKIIHNSIMYLIKLQC